MKIILKKISELKNYTKNARTHDRKQLDDLVDSIKAYGFTLPIEIGEDNVIISGHARVQAAIEVGMITIPTIVHQNLIGSKRKAYILAANKIALKAGWDLDLLKDELSDLRNEGFDLQLTGFDKNEIYTLLDMDFSPGTLEDQGKLDELEPNLIACPHCGQEFNARELL